MDLPSGTYAPRDPAASVLYQVVRDHYQTFLAEASLRDGEGLPRFVALLEAGPVTARILRHLGLRSEVPAARTARAPPLARDDASW